MRSKRRRLFLGGNTGRGFYSFYEQVVQGENRFTYILKGGPGSGKSVLMGRLAEKARAAGMAVDEYLCSSDSHSLDGIHIVDLGLVMIDGTRPHMTDPRHVGAIESIVDLSRYLSREGIGKERDRIRELVARGAFLFNRAYGFLALAREVDAEHSSYLHELSALDRRSLLGLARKLSEELFPGDASSGRGRLQPFFQAAFTPEGLVHHGEDLLLEAEQILVLHGSRFREQTLVTEHLLQTALERGYDAEVFYCPLEPQRVDHFLVREKSLLVMSGGLFYGAAPRDSARLIDTRVYLQRTTLAAYARELVEMRQIFRQAVNSAQELLKKAKANHALLEACYAPHMDYGAVDKLTEHLWQEIADGILAETK